MATMQRTSGEPNPEGQGVVLLAQTTVGRSERCDVRLTHPGVSGLHASIEWGQSGWSVRDLGSRNGTYLNGRPVRTPERGILHVKDVLTFGSPQETWILTSVEPPGPVLARLENGQRVSLVAVTGLHPIPDSEHPLATLYPGGDAGFQLEVAGGCVQPITPDEPFTVDGQQYVLSLLPSPSAGEQGVTVDDAATPLLSLADCNVRIAVDPTQESAAVDVTIRGGLHHLAHRAHFYLFAHLARARQEDASGTGGWMTTDEVVRSLTMDDNYLSVQVFRVRKEFEELGFTDATRIIQRKRGGLLRCGLDPTQIELPPPPAL